MKVETVSTNLFLKQEKQCKWAKITWVAKVCPEAYEQMFEEGINDGNFMCPGGDLK